MATSEARPRNPHPLTPGEANRLRLNAAAPASRPFDRDRLNLLPGTSIARAAFEALHPLQNLTPEEQVAGTALLFAVHCKRLGLTGQGMWDFAERVLNAPDQPENREANLSVQALKDFVSVRVAGQHGVSIG